MRAQTTRAVAVAQDGAKRTRDFLGGVRGLLSRFSDLLLDNRESATLLTRGRGFVRGVEREQVRLLSDRGERRYDSPGVH